MSRTGYVLIEKNKILFCGHTNSEIGILVRYKAICNNFDVDNLTWEQICFNFDRKERKVVSKLFGISSEVDPKFIQSSSEVCPKNESENKGLNCARVYNNDDNNNITNITNITEQTNNSAGAPDCSVEKAKKYAFEGEVIKLKQKDFDDWQRAYPDLNIYAECVVRDGWLKTQPEGERKRWFMSTAAFFAKQNERRKQQHAEQTDKAEKTATLDDILNPPKAQEPLAWL